jgi:hypothetical protein
VIITLFKGFKVNENPLFILIESVLNFLILVDFLFRIKLIGLRKFFAGAGSTSRLWNWLDAVVVLTSVLMFLIILLSHSIIKRESGDDYLSQASEIALLVIWALF